jgi:hypothetical protein
MPDPAPDAAPARPLDDVMLAMDVVDTLRHRASVVERELNADERDQDLIQRLRGIYAAQGMEVPDHVLAEGVKALREDRFTYVPPKPGMEATLARIYVGRAKWLPPLFLALFLVLGAWAAYAMLVTAPRARARREVPRQITALSEQIVAGSKSQAATDRAQEIAAAGAGAAQAGDMDAAGKALEALRKLRADMDLEYDLRIVAEGSTGVWRVPHINTAARNHYIIVQPVAKDGSVLSLPVKSEEDGQVRQANRFGLRVDEATFNSIAADKKDDGIIQKNLFGAKRRGTLEPEYQFPTNGAAITSW